MFIHDLDAKWMEHPFFSSRFLVVDEKSIQRIASAGLRHVYIDTSRGKDVNSGMSAAAIDESLQRELDGVAAEGDKARHLTPAVMEMERARSLYRETTTVVRNLMAATRSGRQVDMAALDPFAERMVQSAFRNPHALAGISRIKTKDEYTFMHCVGVSALLVSFAQEMGLPEQQIYDVAIGGLVHDIGKALVSHEVLNKPGTLSAEEFAQMKNHVSYSGELLAGLPGISQTALDVALLHHERMDGSGYPSGQPGKQISLIGRMSAIVDVYDALTSVRVYKDAWAPTQTMKKLIEWSPAHFDSELVQRFVRCMGIYPVGSLVALESGRVGIVLDQGRSLMQPVIRVIYNRKRRHFERPVDLDLAHHPGDRIVEAVSPMKYGIDVTLFV